MEKIVAGWPDCHKENCNDSSETEMEGIEVTECGLLLFDLDGTLLRSDKSISQRTLQEEHFGIY